MATKDTITKSNSFESLPNCHHFYDHIHITSVTSAILLASFFILIRYYRRRQSNVTQPHSNLVQKRNKITRLSTKINNWPFFRVGIGYDIHRFIVPCDPDNNYIKICGASIKFNKAIDAHSDGDVGIHAIVDAILGAIGCGDIGEHFPPSSEEWKNMDSSHFLNYAVEKARENDYGVSNVDITIICEKPKIFPHKGAMRKRMAELLKISDTLVNIKATTNEKLGAIGRGEGIAAQAVVSVQRLYKGR